MVTYFKVSRFHAATFLVLVVFDGPIHGLRRGKPRQYRTIEPAPGRYVKQKSN
jgi:hypothetical protein